jgi:Ricin-type beta-trefoil lectin domain-like
MSRCAKPHFSTYLMSAIPGLLLMLGFTSTMASASVPRRTPVSFTSIAEAPNGGFWVQVDSGENFSYTLAIDGAPQYQNVPDAGSIIAVPGTNGYWVVTVHGQIYARGGAPTLCGGNPGNLRSCSSYETSDGVITAAAASPNGEGLWAVDESRHVWTAGNVVSYGDVTNDNETPVGMVATASGEGYYIVMNDGGVFVRGDARFYGSTGGNKPGLHDISGIALSFDLKGQQNGYWLVADDGGVFSFGDAPLLGSTGGDDGGRYVTNIITRDEHAYAWVHSNGRVQFSRDIPKVTIQGNLPANAGVWGVTSDGSNTGVYQLPANGSTSQQWDLWPTTGEGDVVQIVNVSSGLCADVENGSGSNIIQYPCKGSDEGWDNQRFRIIRRNPFYCRVSRSCVEFSAVSDPSAYVEAGDDGQLILSQPSGLAWRIVTLDASDQPPDGAVPSHGH